MEEGWKGRLEPVGVPHELAGTGRGDGELDFPFLHSLFLSLPRARADASFSLKCMAWHPKGPVLACGANDSTVWMWQRESLAMRIRLDTTRLSDPEARADSFFRALRTTVPSGNTMQVFAGHTDAITAITFTPDGSSRLILALSPVADVELTVRFSSRQATPHLLRRCLHDPLGPSVFFPRSELQAYR